MKKFIIISFMFIILTSCSSTKFDSLVEQARDHYYSGEYEDAAVIYEKALEIKEDVEVRKQLSNSKNENELLSQHEEFKRKMREYSITLQNIAVYSDLEKVCSNITDTVTQYTSIDATSDLREAKKIKALQSELFIEVILLDASSPYMYKILDGTVYDYAQRIKENIDYILDKAK